MASIIFIVLTALLIFLVVKDYNDELSFAVGCVAVGGMILSGLLIAFSICSIWDGAVAADKIKSYEQGKVRIEKEMGTMVNAYMDYEKDNVKRVSDKDAVSYVTVIPELKSSDLVKQEMALYADYDKRIMKLKEKQADAKFAKFLLYKIF
jgi:hypothetical protein